MNSSVEVKLRTIPDENEGYTRGTLEAMQEMVRAGMEDKTVQSVALNLTGKTQLETVRNDWHYLKQRIAYVPDPVTHERVTSARFTIGHGTPGDCDDMAVAAATLFALQNINSHFEAVQWRTNAYTHVLTVAELESGPLAFDLTLDSLGDSHKAIKILKAPIMAQVETIADYKINDTPTPPTTVQILVDKVAGTNGESPQVRMEALRALHMFYPAQVSATYQWGKQVQTWNRKDPATFTLKAGIAKNLTLSNETKALMARNAKGSEGGGKVAPPTGGLSDIGDVWDWLGAAVSVCTDVITGNWAAIPVVIAGSLTEPPEKEVPKNEPPEIQLERYIEKVTGHERGGSAKGYRDPWEHPELFTLTDPRRKDRNITSYLTYLDELPQAYYSSYAPKGSLVAAPNNYSSVICPAVYTNIPVFTALQKASPSMIFVSFDNETSLLSKYAGLSGKEVGQYGFQLSGLTAEGNIEDFPGYYTRTAYREGGMRYDFVGMSPADIPSTDNGKPVVDLTKLTAYNYLNRGEKPTSRVTGTGNIALPAATPPHVTVTPVTDTNTPGATGTDATGSTNATNAAATAYFKAGGGDAGVKAGVAAFVGAGGNILDWAGILATITKMPFAVSGNTPALPDKSNWFSDNMPLVIGGGAAILLGVILLKK